MNPMKPMNLSVLGQTVREPVKRLDTFPRPANLTEVCFAAHEFTSLCPVTGQPDWGTVTISYAPAALCIESKSLKLWLWGFRQQGAFCEQLASDIADFVFDAIAPAWVRVTVRQASRGGIRTTSTGERRRD